MAASLNSVCRALGVHGSVSICRDVFGFTADHVPAALVATRPKPAISLNRCVQLLRGRHFHARIIIAGDDLLTENDRDVIDYALFRMREIYATAAIGVGRITRDPRSAANSAGHATVMTEDAIAATGHDLTADGDFVPVVLPANMNVTRTNADGTITVTLGTSPTPGPCSPRNGDRMQSSVVDINGEETGRTLAHEIGHFLGADHPSGAPGTNLMAQTGSVADPFNAVSIIDSDRALMRNHCTMRDGLAEI